MHPGETIRTGARDHCDCGDKLEFQVCSSAAGYYIGTQCPVCGPWSRESYYYPSYDRALSALEDDNVVWRTF